MVNAQIERPMEEKHHMDQSAMLAQTTPRRTVPADPIAAGPMNPIMTSFMRTHFPAPSAADRAALTTFMREYSDANASYDQILRDFSAGNPNNSISRYYNLIGQDNVNWIINPRGQVAFNATGLRATVESKLGVADMNQLMRNPPAANAEIFIQTPSENEELATLFVQNAHFPAGYSIRGPENEQTRRISTSSGPRRGMYFSHAGTQNIDFQ